jgi:hypothetical protein
MKTYSTKPAFSLMTAIFVIMLMSSVGIFVLNLSGKIIKATTTQYQHEQAELYAKSYTEYAVLAVTGNNRANNCLETVNATIGDDPTHGNGYRVRTHISYIGPVAEIGNCATIRQLSTNVTTEKTPLTIIIDAYVDFKDPEHTDGPWMTVHRRTVQKI